ncbi:hypothetical protein ACFWY9_26170 [Amycolatopsis sp. NPDC059027]|uniref:hypothetical protein n=1 Tax=unclassified Amycolatopsis TaxID=2618356 RepID=UPI00366EE761
MLLAAVLAAGGATLTAVPAASADSAADVCAEAAFNAPNTGFKDDKEHFVIAVAVGMAESHCNPTAEHHNGSGSTDYGLWQINDHYHPEWTKPECRFDKTCNAQAAWVISSGAQNWCQWNTFDPCKSAPQNLGTYRNFLADAQAAVDKFLPGPPRTNSAPAATSSVEYNGELAHFERTADGSLGHWFYPDEHGVTGFDTWATNGVKLAGKPTAIIYSGQITVFARGTDGSLLHWFYPDENHATGFDVWGGGLAGDPTAVVYHNELTVFAQGTDGSLKHWFYPDGNGSTGQDTWASNGVAVAGRPTAVVYHDQLTVFAHGADGSLLHWFYPDEHGVAGFDSWGGGIAGDPEATVYHDELTVFAQGSDNTLQHFFYPDNGTTGRDTWTTTGIGITGKPGVTIFSGQLTVFARGTDGSLAHWFYPDEHGVTGFDSWGGGIAGDPDTAPVYTNQITLFAKGEDGSLQHFFYPDTNGVTGRDVWGGAIIG